MVSFSGQHQEQDAIALHHAVLEASLRHYYSSTAPTFAERFAGLTLDEVATELAERLQEVDLTSCMSSLSAMEASFRIDFLQRCHLRLKDALSRFFRDVHKTKQERPQLDEEILEGWAKHEVGCKFLISELRGAFNFRNWLAHGRYWTPKLGRKYDYQTIYLIARRAESSLPFKGVDAL